MDKIESPNDLSKLFKFAINLKKVDLGKAREIYEESIRLVQMHIDNGNCKSLCEKKNNKIFQDLHSNLQ